MYFPEKNDKFKKYGELVAEWNPNNIRGKEFIIFDINATGKINQNSTYELAFWNTGGTHRLEIEKVEVFKNEKKIAEDKHPAFTGEQSKNNIYSFDINDYENARNSVNLPSRNDFGFILKNTEGENIIRSMKSTPSGLTSIAKEVPARILYNNGTISQSVLNVRVW